MSIKVFACLLSQSCSTRRPFGIAHQAPLPLSFYRQEYWNGLPYPSPVKIFTHLLIGLSVFLLLSFKRGLYIWGNSGFFFIFYFFVFTRSSLLLLGLPLVSVSGDCSSLQCMGFSFQWALLQITGSRYMGFKSCSMRA